MPTTDTTNADSGSVESTPNPSEYSRRNFMEAAGAVGAAGATAGVAGCLDDIVGGTSEPDFVWWSMRGGSLGDALEDAADDFAEQHDEELNVTTNFVPWGEVNTEWNTAIQGHSTPNVSEMGGGHSVEFADLGVVDPHTELLAEYDDMYEINEQMVKWEGDAWGIPWFSESRTLFTNTELLEEAGHSGAPEDWTELVNVGQDVVNETDASGFTTAGATDLVTGQHTFLMNVQAGGQYYDYDEDAEEWSVEMDDAAGLFTHLWKASLEREWDITPGGWAGVDGIETQELYNNESTAMVLEGGHLARDIADDEELREKTEIVPMPAGPMGDSRSFLGGGVLTAFSSEYTQHDAGRDVADDFIQYIVQTDVMDTYLPAAAPQFLPVRDAQEEMELFTDNPTDIPDEWIDTFIQGAQDAVLPGVYGADQNAPFLGEMDTVTTGNSEAISAIIGGDADPREALVDQANANREQIEEHVDYDLPETEDGPDLDDAPEECQAWINGDGDTPQIWNPYE